MARERDTHTQTVSHLLIGYKMHYFKQIACIIQFPRWWLWRWWCRRRSMATQCTRQTPKIRKLFTPRSHFGYWPSTSCTWNSAMKSARILNYPFDWRLVPSAVRRVTTMMRTWKSQNAIRPHHTNRFTHLHATHRSIPYRLIENLIKYNAFGIVIIMAS